MVGVLFGILGWTLAFATDCPDVLRRGQDVEVRIQDQSFGISILSGAPSGGVGQLVATWTDRQTGQIQVRRQPLPAPGQGMAEFYLLAGTGANTQIRLKAAAVYFGTGVVWAIGVEHHPEVDPFLLLDLSALGGDPTPYCFPGEFLPGAYGDLSHAILDFTEQSGTVLSSKTGLLALPRLQHQVTGQIFSSSDLTGGNSDGFESTNYLSESGGTYQLAETWQPSVLTWSFYQPILPAMSPQYLPQTIRLFWSGETTPRFEGFARDYFNGGVAGYPAATQYAGNGGYVDYSGVSAPKGLRIEGNAATFYHYFLMRGLSSLDAKRLADPTSVVGTSVPDIESFEIPVILKPFESKTLLDESGAPGVITQIRAENGVVPIDPAQLGARITFDGHATPDIDLTLEGLFLRTGALGTNLPMPFDSSARFELTNFSSKSVAFSIHVDRLNGQFPKPYGYLRGVADEGNIPSTAIDFKGRERVGRGKVVAERYETTEQLSTIPENPSLWEGDPRHQVDGQIGASYSLTGTEDFSFWGWYFTPLDQAFSNPMASYDGQRFIGNTMVRSETVFRGEHTAIHYYSSWTPSFEHGGYNEIPYAPAVARAKHTAFVYSQDSVELVQDSVVDPSVFPNQKTVTDRFEGDSSHTEHARVLGYSQTPVEIPIHFSPNNLGLRLEFVLLRFEDAPCRAEITFEDHVVGTLTQPWAPRSEFGIIKFFEDSLEIPAALTNGLEQGQLRIVPQGCVWVQSDLRVKSYRP